MLSQVSRQRVSLLPYFHVLGLHSLENAIMGQYPLLYSQLLLEVCSDYRHPKLWLIVLSFLYWLFLILGYTSCFNLLKWFVCPASPFTRPLKWSGLTKKKRKSPGKNCWGWYYPANSSYHCSEEHDDLWNFTVSLWLGSHYMLILILCRECTAQQEITRHATTSWIAAVGCKQLRYCCRKSVFLLQRQRGRCRGLQHSSCAGQHPLAHDWNLRLYISLWNKWIHNSVMLNFL